jgi:hypothetical protein
MVVKALMKYQYTIVQPDAASYMITDAEQVEHKTHQAAPQAQQESGPNVPKQ